MATRCREGTRILVHYESHMRIDYLLQIEIRVIGLRNTILTV